MLLDRQGQVVLLGLPEPQGHKVLPEPLEYKALQVFKEQPVCKVPLELQAFKGQPVLMVLPACEVPLELQAFKGQLVCRGRPACKELLEPQVFKEQPVCKVPLELQVCKGRPGLMAQLEYRGLQGQAYKEQRVPLALPSVITKNSPVAALGQNLPV